MYWTRTRGFANIQAVILQLALVEHQGSRILQPYYHHVWLDNLFTTSGLLAELRTYSTGASGTVRSTPTKAELLKGSKVDGDVILLESTLAQSEISQDLHQISQETKQKLAEPSQASASSQPSQSSQPRRKARKEPPPGPKVAKGTGMSHNLLELKRQYSTVIDWDLSATLY